MQKVKVGGLDALQRTLENLQGDGGMRIEAAALRGGVKPVKPAIRKQVNTLKKRTALKRAARASIGSSVKKIRGTKHYMAKAGFGVGRSTKVKKTKAHERSVYGQGGAKLATGVGLASANIHWATLGTTGRTTKSGRRTGKMPAFLKGMVKKAAMSSKAQMIQGAAHSARIALKKEAKRRI